MRAEPVSLSPLTWWIINLRWAWLIIVSLALGLSDTLRQEAVVLLSLGLILNSGLAVLEFAGLTRAHHLDMGFLADMVLALSLFGVSNLTEGPLNWVGLWPALMVGLRYNWQRTLITLLMMSIGQIALVMLIGSSTVGLIIVGIAALFVWPVALGASWVGQQVRAWLQQRAKKQQAPREAELKRLRQHTQALADMATTLLTTQSYEQVLEAGLRLAACGAEGRTLEASEMVSAILLFADDRLQVGPAWHLPATDLRRVCPGREGVLGESLRTRELVLTRDPANDPELGEFVAWHNCQSLLSMPLRGGYDMYGVAVFGHPRTDFFDSADQRDFFCALFNQASAAMQNARLYADLNLEKQRLMEVQEDASKRLARDLHDGPTQAVAALAMRANFARRLVERDPKAAAEEIFRIEELARATTKEIRHMLFTLRPLSLESQGLVAALKQLAEKMRDTHRQAVLVEAEPYVEDRLDKNQHGPLFYIAEEAVNNARKHAQAAHVWIRLKTNKNVLVMEIEDDGVGFNVGAIDSNYDRRGSLGMVNMRERAEILGGAVKVDSHEGLGTKITVLLPLQK